MEIEAKYQISDEETFQQLLATDTLAGFTLGSESISELHDRYLETKDGAIRTGGYACRIRQSGSLTVATLKGLGGVSGAIHRRVEHEVELPRPLPPQEWPAGTVRDILLHLCGSCELITLFEVKQTRHSRSLRDGNRLIAEVSLNRVQVYKLPQALFTFLELEAEMLAGGHVEDLEKLGSELRETWGLAADSLSKYDRGLALTTQN